MDRTHPDEQRVEQRVELPVPAHELWRAITDDALLADWLGAEVELDVRPGAAGRVVDHDGTVREVVVTSVDPGRSVTWHWWTEGDGISTVELTVETDGPGTSRLRIIEVLGTHPGRDAATRTSACARRWERATSRLWQRVGLVGAR